jgi:hypothetical protein
LNQFHKNQLSTFLNYGYFLYSSATLIYRVFLPLVHCRPGQYLLYF